MLLRYLVIALALVLASVAVSGPTQGEIADHNFTLPPGFEIQRVAGPPLVNRPIVADFDEQGRLYVADSSGSNDKVEQQLAQKPHRIVRLEDKDGDGIYDASTIFADRMMFPEGTMWFDGSLYVAAPPSIWKLTDSDGDGVADQREEWFEGKTLTNCANDLHGPYLGPDGWIYWTKGAFAEQKYERAGKAPFVTRAAHIFRRRPQAGVVEPVMNGGMDNPVDVAFTPAGERILTATFLEHPQLGRRDAIIHAIYGGLYGKPHAVIEGHIRTGDLMPELTHLGPAAPAGLTRYASRVFGDEYRDNFFATMFNLRKVTRHALTPRGASFSSRDSDFLVSDNLDFHPTDVLEDADGSLLVVDTGAWYKLCCPTAQLAKPEVLGSIYRVRRLGAPKVEDPRGLRLQWDALDAGALTKLLDDRRPAVQNRAIQQLARSGERAVAALAAIVRSSASVEARRNAVWTLTRIDVPAAREVVRAALRDADRSVRQAAAHSAAVWRDGAAVNELLRLLKEASPAVQRVAAEALGRIGDAAAVRELIGVAAAQLDRALEHSITYALIEIGDPAATTAGLRMPASRSKRAALIALDQMEGGGLKPERIVPLLDSPDAILKETAWWIAGRHPDWGGTLAGFFERRLTRLAVSRVEGPQLTAAEREDLQQKLSQFSGTQPIQQLLANTVHSAQSREARLTALGAMARTRLKELPAAWVAALKEAIAKRNAEEVALAIAVARGTPAAKDAARELYPLYTALANDASLSVALRLDALAVGQSTQHHLNPEEFELVRASLESAQPAAIRVAAAAIIEKAKLDEHQLRALVEVLAAVGPLELPRLLAPFDKAEEALGLEMIAALERSKARSSLRPDMLRPRLATHSEGVQVRGEALLASLNAETAKQAGRLEELLTTLPPGDIRRGQLVFNSPKAACLSCHAIGYAGGKIGPDLTRIGQIRSERDLLEAIVFPSASFARGYEPVMVTTTAGAVHSGILRSDARDEVVLATAERQETRLRREEVEEMQPGTVSMMPPGLDEQLTRQELADLLAFLKATRSGAS
jgi:putative membrane-bound dehydrogenase-like protein